MSVTVLEQWDPTNPIEANTKFAIEYWELLRSKAAGKGNFVRAFGFKTMRELAKAGPRSEDELAWDIVALALGPAVEGVIELVGELPFVVRALQVAQYEQRLTRAAALGRAPYIGWILRPKPTFITRVLARAEGVGSTRGLGSPYPHTITEVAKGVYTIGSAIVHVREYVTRRTETDELYERDQAYRAERTDRPGGNTGEAQAPQSFLGSLFKALRNWWGVKGGPGVRQGEEERLSGKTFRPGVRQGGGVARFQGAAFPFRAIDDQRRRAQKAIDDQLQAQRKRAQEEERKRRDQRMQALQQEDEKRRHDRMSQLRGMSTIFMSGPTRGMGGTPSIVKLADQFDREAAERRRKLATPSLLGGGHFGPGGGHFGPARIGSHLSSGTHTYFTYINHDLGPGGRVRPTGPFLGISIIMHHR